MLAQKMKNENIKGAKYILRNVLSSLKEAIAQFADNQLVENIKTSCKILFNIQPSMALLANSLALILHSLDSLSKEHKHREALRENLLQQIFSLLESYENELKMIPRQTSKILSQQANILTYSFSSTVYDAIKYQKQLGHDLNIFITEARPNNEGLLGAQEFSKLYPTTLFVDAGIGYILQNYPIDLVLLGADSFTENELIHKIGTLPLALTARAFGIPVYALAHSLKYYYGDSLGIPITIEAKPPTEITDLNSETLQIQNYYFDRTPMKYLEGVFTERGLLRSHADYEQLLDNFPIQILGELYQSVGECDV